MEIKICGITCVDDALLCVDAGVEAIGINFWPQSPRCCDLDTATAIHRAVGQQTQLVAVVVDADLDAIERIRQTTGIEWIQLHGDESPEFVEALLPRAYKALAVGGPQIVANALRYGGEHLLLDAAVAGRPGGTGKSFDWSLAAAVSAAMPQRRITLAGGLRPDNVAAAMAAARPFRVDTASGVEHRAGAGRPPRKDPRLLQAFVNAVRQFSKAG